MATADPNRPQRELQAYREIGVTDISPRLARLLCVCFVLSMCLLPLVEGLRLVGHGSQVAAQPTGSSQPDPPTPITSAQLSLLERAGALNQRLLAEIERCNSWSRNRLLLSTTLRPLVQSLLTRGLGAGNEKVIVGRDNWLFYRPAVDHLIGPGFLRPHPADSSSEDPMTVIIDFRNQLAARGIELIVLPTPVKASVHPEQLASRSSFASRPLHNPSSAHFAATLKDAGVTLVDLSPALAQLSATTGKAVYLARDTHWTPAAVEHTAVTLARLIQHLVPLPEAQHSALSDSVVELAGTGDLTSMLDLPDDGSANPSQRISIRPVKTEDGTALQPEPGAPVLLLGDSFSNIYSQPALGWGAGAGLGERLAFHLGTAIDAVLRNDDGAMATRRELARQLAADPQRLETTRVVVWEFTARELSHGDWQRIELPVAGRSPSATPFIRLAAGQSVIATGTVADAAAVADPRDAPYADYMRALLLDDVRCEPPCSGTRALVFVPAMLDRVLVFGATPQPGDRIHVRLSPWSETPDQIRGASRGELLDPEVFFEVPLFGEEVQQ